jgi:anti-sigma regulatory factor (Ser/Thr protein kinase)
MAVAAREESRVCFRFAWPATLAALAAARRAVEVLPLATDPASIDDLRLLICEVVSNAVIHSGLGSDDTVEMLVEVRPQSVRVNVVDRGKGFELHRPRNPRSVGGLGFRVVDRLASTWGIISAPRFGVWFELPIGYRTERAASAA